MNYKQNEKINQVKESTLVVGIDIGSTTQYARAFDWRGIELGKPMIRRRCFLTFIGRHRQHKKEAVRFQGDVHRKVLNGTGSITKT